MDLLLLHLVLLMWLSIAAAGRWTDHPADRCLAAGALGWTNLLVTSLLLSPQHQLGQQINFITTSAGLALAIALVAWRFPAPSAKIQAAADANIWLQFSVIATLVPLALATAIAALNYPPSSPAASAYELPRALLQIGEGSILPLPVADMRLVILPFNYGLIQSWVLAYQLPLSALNFLNLLGWLAAGIAVNRLCRAAGASANSALVSAWCAMTTTPILAHAATADHSLPAAASLIAALAFAIDWARRGRIASAVFAGLLIGLAGGSTTAMLVFVSLIVATACVFTSRLPVRGRKPAWCVMSLCLLPCLINLAVTFVNGPAQLFASIERMIHTGDLFNPGLIQLPWKIPQALNAPSEYSVGPGVSGLVCIIAGVISLRDPQSPNKTTPWLALIAFAWLGALLAINYWLPVGTGDGLISILLLAPAVAALLDRISIPRMAFGIGFTLAAVNLYSAHLYIWSNLNRPLAALIDRGYPMMPLPALQPLIKLRLNEAMQINLISDGEDPQLLALLTCKTQHVGTRNMIVPDAYNIISRDHRARRRTLRELAEGPASLMIAFPSKPTAGIEFLGQVGLDKSSRDYFGISGQAEQAVPIPTNCTLLLTLKITDKTSAPQALQADLLGLNPRDNASLEIYAEKYDGQSILLASFSKNETKTFRMPTDLHYLRMKIVSTADRRELGNSVLTDYPVMAAYDNKLDVTNGKSGSLLFLSELVGPESSEPVRAEPSLGAMEGPFPQWDLPLIRWARAATIKLQIPSTKNLARVRLRIEARLHIRSNAILEIAANNKVLRRLEFRNATEWLETVIEFPAQLGENIIELRDIPLPPEPDWIAYMERYPDVKRYAEGIRQPLREAAWEHYRLSGQHEGRIMTYLPPLADNTFFFMFRRMQVQGLLP